MPKTKISEFSATPGNNTDIDGINIAEGCAPSGINDAIRELMAQLKDFQAGTAGDSFNGPVGTTTAAAGAFTTLSSTGNTTLGDASGDAVTINGATTFVNVSPTITPGTANGVAYLNGSKVLTTGSALTFDGTNFGVGTTSPASTVAATGSTSTTLGFSVSPNGWNNARHRLTVPISGDESVWSWNYTGTALDSASYGTSTIGLTSSVIKFSVGATNTAPTEQMRLTSTGLGIGTSSPAYKLDVQGGAGSSARVRSSSAYAALLLSSQDPNAGTRNWLVASNWNAYGDFALVQSNAQNGDPISSGTVRLNIDSSGNLGLGVTPSAWGGSYKAIQFASGAIAGFSTTALDIYGNAYDIGAGAWRYLNSSQGATRYAAFNGAHQWFTAPSGTAGNAISFTQAMTLAADGNLLVGTTTSSGTSGRLHVAGTSVGGEVSARIENLDSSNAVSETGLRFMFNGALKGYVGTVYGSAGASIMYFYNNGAERARITSSGDLLVGTTTSAGKLTVQSSVIGESIVYNNANTGVTASHKFGYVVQEGGTDVIYLRYRRDGSGTAELFNVSANLAFGTGNTERARIDSSGNLLVGKTASGNTLASGAGFTLAATNTTASHVFTSSNANWMQVLNRFDAGAGYFLFQIANSIVGSIGTNGTSTSYNTSSDYRLKHDIAPMTGALAKVAQLKPVTYKWNADNSDGEGFIAHELAEVVPQCVTGEKDAVDADGKPIYQGIDTSFLVATLTAAIQELKAEFEAYKATHP